MRINICNVLITTIFLLTQTAFADTVIVNNNNQPAQPQNSSCNNTANNGYDPRVPPAGSYVIQNNDGSSQQLYTTGQTQPYRIDNGCNNTTIVAPYGYGGGQYPHHHRHR